MVEMRNKYLLTKADRLFSRIKISFSKQGVLGETALNNSLRKTITKKGEKSAKEA